MPSLDPKNKSELKLYSASEKMKNKDYVSAALWQCLISNDIDSFKDILRTHLDVVNKESFSKKSGIPQRTLFRILSPSGNPTLETIGKIIHQICA
jgi:DNA-binding phage protein